MQGNSSVKTLRFPLSSEFWKHVEAKLNPTLCLNARAKKQKYKFK